MLSLAVAIFMLSLLVVAVTIVMVQIRIPECPKCPDSGGTPAFDCNNCTVPEVDCSQCPADHVKCRAAFLPDCTRCPTDCIKANSDPLCNPDCTKCSTRCPVDLNRCRDALDNLYFSADRVNLSELPYARANVLINDLVEGRLGFSMRFKPTSNFGILCAFIESTSMFMYLVEGKVRLLIRSTSSSETYNDHPVNTELPRHQVAAVALTTSPGSTDVIVTVNTTQQTIQAPASITFSTKMYVGGVPNDNLTDLPAIARVNFKGCIYEVKSALDTPLDLTEFTRSNVDLGCQ